MNVFDWNGHSFLLLYAALLALTVAAGLSIPRWLRPEGRGASPTDAEELAFLAGGRIRFADAVIARLLAGRSLAVVGRDAFLIEVRGGGTSAADRAVLNGLGPTKLSAIDERLRPHADRVEERLVASGALLDRATTLRMRLWHTAPYAVPLLVGGLKLEVGLARDRPVGLLVAMMLATLALGAMRFAAVDRRTRLGLAALRRARAGADRLRRAPTASEADRAVALWGTAVLAGSAWGALHDMRRASDGGSASDSGGEGGDGSGDGGCSGGCGGCGS